MQEWEKIEDEKYSHLYKNGYPDGDPDMLTLWGKIATNTSILDLGCGNGRLASIYNNYVGIDVAASVIDINRKKYPKKSFIHCGMSQVNSVLRGSNFDVAVCADVIEHIPPDKVVNIIEKISRVNANIFLFGVSTRASKILAQNGENLHLTVWPPEKWLKVFGEYYTITEYKMQNPSLIYIKCHKKG